MTAPAPKQPRQPLASMKERRDEGVRRRTQARESRWREQRLAVPYRTDGPKISLSVLWFAAIIGSAALVGPPLLALVVAVVAGIAGLQVGHVWAPVVDRRLTAGVAAAVAISGAFGALGLGVAVILGVLGLTTYAAGTVKAPPKTRGGPSHGEVVIYTVETLIRSSLPVGVAAGALVAIDRLEFSGFLALVLLVSAYEAGDFLIGTGSANAIEGPVAGIVAMVVVAAGLYLVLPAPFTTDSFPLFVLLAAVAAPVGQIAGSAILPRGDAWAPALRRLDSYLVAAPLWLLLLPRI